MLRNGGNLLHDGAQSRLCGVRDERHRLHGDLSDSEPLGCRKKKPRHANTWDETTGDSESLNET